MKLTCTLAHLPSARWMARHTGSSTGQVEVTALTREEALAKMRDELQYRIEWCPCSGASGDTVELGRVSSLDPLVPPGHPRCGAEPVRGRK